MIKYFILHTPLWYIELSKLKFPTKYIFIMTESVEMKK